MRASHGLSRVTVRFDEPNLVSDAGLVPLMVLAERAGLSALADQRLTLAGSAGHAAGAKVSALIAGMCAGADSIADMDLLRSGGLPRLFAGVRAPSTLGTFLRAFRFGHVRQLDAIAERWLVALSRRVPLLPGAAELTYLDIDDTVKATYGYAKRAPAMATPGSRDSTRCWPPPRPGPALP